MSIPQPTVDGYMVIPNLGYAVIGMGLILDKRAEHMEFVFDAAPFSILGFPLYIFLPP